MRSSSKHNLVVNPMAAEKQEEAAATNAVSYFAHSLTQKSGRCASKYTRSGIWYVCCCALAMLSFFLSIHHFSRVGPVSVRAVILVIEVRGCIATPASPWIIPYFISTYTFMLIFCDLTHITTHTRTQTRVHEPGIPLCISPFILHCQPLPSLSLLALRISHFCSFRSFFPRRLSACIDSRAQHIHQLVS